MKDFDFPKLSEDTNVDVNFSAMEYDWVQRSISLECHGTKFVSASFTYNGTTACEAEYITYAPRDENSFRKIVQTYNFPADIFDETYISILRIYLNGMENPLKTPPNLMDVAIQLYNKVLDIGTFVSEESYTEYAD